MASSPDICTRSLRLCALQAALNPFLRAKSNPDQRGVREDFLISSNFDLKWLRVCKQDQVHKGGGTVK